MPDSIEFTIPVSDESIRDILIARLADAGAIGFEEEKNVLKAFIAKGETGELLFEEIIQNIGLRYEKSIVYNQNWNALWEAGFEPVSVGRFCNIRAAFHKPVPGVKHDIIITPKMSFGTGHHATTYLMIQAMERIDFLGKSVFDFGTGTGVLAILAEKCGSESVTAIDNDEWSINNASENLNINDCRKVLVYKENGFFNDRKYDVVLANINRNIILQEMEKIQQHIVKNGVVLLSGLLTGDEQIIVAEAMRCRLEFKRKTEMNGWICLLMVNP